ncbi:MAG: nuclear transport factor 2 family protein [Acidobacteria bacterium]|nr:nuclear transport factor 2 family protein [Acidobacteriota bacterium]
MRKYYLGLVIIAFLSLFFAACGGPAANTNVNSNSGPKNTATNGNTSGSNVITNSPAGTTVKPVAETVNDAPTLAPVVNAYYNALKTKNSAALKDVLTAEFLARSEAHMKEDGGKDLAAYMAEFDTIPEKPVEVRNEKIEGNKAVCELRGGAYPNWTAFAFAKEDGKWKFTGGSPDLTAVKGN